MDNKILEEWLVENPGFSKDCSELKRKIEKWLKNAKKKEKEILFKLFTKSHYYSKPSIFLFFKELNKNLNNRKDTLYSAIESQIYRMNSSHKYLTELSADDNIGIPDINIKPSIRQATDTAKAKNIVFIDDMVGTGKTVIDFFKSIEDIITGKKVYLWVVCITKQANESINSYALEKKFDIEVLYKREEKKAFENGYIFNSDEYEINKQIIEKYECKLWDNNSKFILGFDDSQCLVSFYSGTPNNTLSSFWFKNETYTPIFIRKDKKENFKDKKEKRKRQNYERSVIENEYQK